MKSDRFLSVDLEKVLVPNIEFLKSCGITMELILKYIYIDKRLLLNKPEVIKKYVDRADELGVDRDSKMFFHALRGISSMSNKSWELNCQSFRDLGFTEEGILGVFRSAPIVFLISTNKIRKIKEILLETKKYDASCIVNYPVSLCYSVETRYKPRLEVLETLQNKNLIEKWPTLATLAVILNKSFCERYVYPFSNELRDVKLMIVSKSR